MRAGAGGTREAFRQAHREQHGDDPNRQGEHANRAHARQRPVGRLPHQLEPQRFFRPPALVLECGPLRIEPRSITIECLFERGDGDPGEPGLEVPEQATPAVSRSEPGS